MEFTPRHHKKDPEFCRLQEERNTVRKKPQQILVFGTFWEPLRLREAQMRHYPPPPKKIVN